MVGATSPDLIAKHKKTRAFLVGDYELLLAYAGRAPLLVTPNIATETSNLIAFHGEPERGQLFAMLQALLASFREHYVASSEAAGHPDFGRLGLTDAAILVGSGQAEILTADNELCIAAQRRGLRAINFNHLRDGRTV